MRYVLKNRNSFPPGGWVFRQPETGWSAPLPMSDSFATTVKRIEQHRLANPGSPLPIDAVSISADLDAFTCARLGNDPSYCESIPDGQTTATIHALHASTSNGCRTCGR
jgi:hypothetical protein